MGAELASTARQDAIARAKRRLYIQRAKERLSGGQTTITPVPEQADRDVAALYGKDKGLPIVRDIKAGLGQTGLSLIAGVKRLTGDAKGADRAIRAKQRLSGALGSVNTEDNIPDMAQRAVASATESLSKLAILSPAGAPGVITGFAADRANQAITEGKDAGLKGGKLLSYAARAGAIEGGITAVFQGLGKFIPGFGGLESLAIKNAAKEGVASSLKKAGKGLVGELTEENVINIIDGANQTLSRVNPEALKNAATWRSIFETSTTTALTFGTGVSVSKLDNARSSSRKDVADALGLKKGARLPDGLQTQAERDAALKRHEEQIAALGADQRRDLDARLEPLPPLPDIFDQNEPAPLPALAPEPAPGTQEIPAVTEFLDQPLPPLAETEAVAPEAAAMDVFTKKRQTRERHNEFKDFVLDQAKKLPPSFQATNKNEFLSNRRQELFSMTTDELNRLANSSDLGWFYSQSTEPISRPNKKGYIDLIIDRDAFHWDRIQGFTKERDTARGSVAPQPPIDPATRRAELEDMTSLELYEAARDAGLPPTERIGPDSVLVERILEAETNTELPLTENEIRVEAGLEPDAPIDPLQSIIDEKTPLTTPTFSKGDIDTNKRRAELDALPTTELNRIATDNQIPGTKGKKRERLIDAILRYEEEFRAGQVPRNTTPQTIREVPGRATKLEADSNIPEPRGADAIVEDNPPSVATKPTNLPPNTPRSVADSIVDTNSPINRVRRAIHSIRDKFSVVNWIDTLDPVFTATKEAEVKIGRKLAPEHSPQMLAEGLRGTHHSIAHYMVNKGMVNRVGETVGKPLKAAADLVGSKNRDAFGEYLVAKRALAIHNDKKNPGRNPGVDKQVAQDYVTEIESGPNAAAFKEAADIVYAWNDAILDYMASFSPDFAEAVAKIREKDPGFYVPLLRDVEDKTGRLGGNATHARFANIGKRLFGSGRRIKDPFQTIISTATQRIEAAHKRAVYESLYGLSKIPGMEHVIKEVPRDVEVALQRNLKDLAAHLDRELSDFDGGVDTGDATSQDLAERIVTFYTQAIEPKDGEPIIPLRIDGKIRWFEVDKPIYEALKEGMQGYGEAPRLFGAEKVIQAVTRSVRMGTTGLRPAFSTINALRDGPTFWMQSQSSANPALALGTWLRQMGGSFTHNTLRTKANPYLDLFEALGGPIANTLGADQVQTRSESKRIFRGGVMKYIHPSNVVDYARDVIQFPESASRATEMELLARDLGIKRGAAPTFGESLKLRLAAKQVTTDFSAHGRLGGMMNQINPFFNAAIQGPRASVRAGKRNPQKFILRALTTVTLPTIAQWLVHKDDEWYEEMDPRERYLWWHINAGDTQIRIPRPFELGLIFGSLPESMLDAWYRQDPERAVQWAKTFVESSTPGFITPVGEELLEQFANEDFFFDRPIVPKGQEDMPKPEQFNEYTTRVSRFLGDTFNQSPARIDHAIRGTTGPLGIDLIEAVGLGGTSILQENSEPADIPVITRLFRRGGRTGTHPESVSKLYDAYEEAYRQSRSKRTTETPEQTDERLKLKDATDGVGALNAIRRQTDDPRKREALVKESIAIAKLALDKASERGTVTRLKKLAEVREAWSVGIEESKLPGEIVKYHKKLSRAKASDQTIEDFNTEREAAKMWMDLGGITQDQIKQAYRDVATQKAAAKKGSR